MLKFILPLIALGGVAFGLYVVKTGAKPVPVAQPVADPSQPPFAHYIAGSGIIEASTENIQISTPIPGMVTEIPVHVGQQVNQGDLLFEIDTRDLEAELKVREAALQLARAKVPEAQASVDDARRMYEMYQAVSDPRAITQEELSKRKFAVVAAESRLAQAMADVVSVQAQVSQTNTEISRCMITAPVTGQVLQLKIHLGEYAQVGPLATPLMVLGETRQLNIRTDIDENDAWRFSNGARAVAYVRGNPKLSTILSFVRIEPYVVPKRSLTGDSLERVDTRVLQVLYGFQREELQVFVGQQMDVYIDVPGESLATQPTSAPTLKPTTIPTKLQTASPTTLPVDSPATMPVEPPTTSAAATPTIVPTTTPSSLATATPTSLPSVFPAAAAVAAAAPSATRPAARSTKAPTTLPTTVRSPR